jgi:hypothetical protein
MPEHNIGIMDCDRHVQNQFTAVIYQRVGMGDNCGWNFMLNIVNVDMDIAFHLW